MFSKFHNTHTYLRLFRNFCIIPKLVKNFNFHMILEGTLSCSLPKGNKEAIAVDSANRPCQVNFELNREYFGRTKTKFLAASPKGLQTYRSFSSAIDKKDGNGVVVKHDLTKQMFYVDIESFDEGYIEYDRKGELIILKHTFVSQGLGGRGIGKILAKEALEYVVKNNLQLEIQCSFIREYVCKFEPKYIKYIQK